MSDQQEVEKNFKLMLDNNPNRMCIVAVNYILDNMKSLGMDVTNMRAWADEKAKTASNISCILPL